MSKLPSDTIESMAITQFRLLLDKVARETYLKHHIGEEDRRPFWDGYIEFYDKDYKNVRGIIDIQIKGRTIGKGAFPEVKNFSDIPSLHLSNYAIRGGTILIVCLFRNDYKESQLYYAPLLPYNIEKILTDQQKHKDKNPSIKLTRIKDVGDLRDICENFIYDKQMQNGLTKNNFNNAVLRNKYGEKYEFRSYGSSIEDAISKLFTEERFLYTIDESGRTIDVAYNKISSIELYSKSVVKDSFGNTVFSQNNISTMNANGKETFKFGNSFTLNLTDKTFSIKLRGTFKSRLNELRYLQNVIKTNKIYIDNNAITVMFTPSIKKLFKHMHDTYEKVVAVLEKNSIDTGTDVDNWTNTDFIALGKWLASIEEGTPINLGSNVLGLIHIGTLSLSAFCVKRSDGLYDAKSIWNIKNYNGELGEFRCDFDNGTHVKTSSLFLALPPNAYLADDFNADVAKNSIEWEKINAGEYEMANLQALNAIKAFDENHNRSLLLYAEWMLDNLAKYNRRQKDIYFINKQQIRKRLGTMTENDIETIIRIKDKTTIPTVKLCCCLLIGSENEAHSIFKNLSEEEQNRFRSFPIHHFLHE